jgi:hypothetical protein
MSSPTYPRFYQKDQLQVQMELFQLIDDEYVPALQKVFKMPAWLDQNEPLPRDTMKTFCPKYLETREFVCVFCRGVSFLQSTKAVEHIQKHFGLQPFDCEEW